MKSYIRTAATCMILSSLLGTAQAENKAEAVVDYPFNKPPQTRAFELTEGGITKQALEAIIKKQEGATTLEKLQAATSIETFEDAAKYLNRASIELLDGKVGFEKDKLLLFVWQGSASDNFYVSPLISWPPEAKFTYDLGQDKNLKTHVKIFALQKDAKWSISSSEIIRFQRGNDDGNATGNNLMTEAKLREFGKIQGNDNISIRLGHDEMQVSDAIQKLAEKSGVIIEVDEKALQKGKAHLESTIDIPVALMKATTLIEHLDGLLDGSDLVSMVKKDRIVVTVPASEATVPPEEVPDRAKDGPGVLIVARYTDSDTMRKSGMIGETYWFEVVEVIRFDREKAPEIAELYEIHYTSVRNRMKNLGGYNKLGYYIRYSEGEEDKSVKRRHAFLDRTLKPGSKYILALKSSDAFTTDGLRVPRKLAQADGGTGLIMPYAEDVLKNIDKVFMAKMQEQKKVIDEEDISKFPPVGGHAHMGEGSGWEIEPAPERPAQRP